MTITFPRDLPEPHKIRSMSFLPQYQQSMAPLRGGEVEAIDLGVPLWRPVFQTAILTETQGLIWEAWFESLGGSVRTFKAWNPLRRYALGYRAGYGGLLVGGEPWNGTGILEDVAVQLDAIDVSGLPVGFKLAVGDMLSYSYATGRQALHRVFEAVTADGDGEATISVRPNVKPVPDEDAVVSFIKPWCKAIVDTKSIRVEWETQAPDRMATVSFEAVQTHI